MNLPSSHQPTEAFIAVLCPKALLHPLPRFFVGAKASLGTLGFQLQLLACIQPGSTDLAPQPGTRFNTSPNPPARYQPSHRLRVLRPIPTSLAASCAALPRRISHIAFLRGLLQEGLDDTLAQAFLSGTYVQTRKLLEEIAKNVKAIREGALQALCANGFAPSEEQQKVIAAVIESLEKGERAVHLVEGGPGSGKTYVALLLFTAVALRFIRENDRKNAVALGFRNNRLLNTVKRVLDEAHIGLSSTVKFFSAGDNGLADRSTEDFELVIYDEAQRMAPNQIPNAVCRGRVVIFLYDQEQRLCADEGGTREEFEGAATASGKKVHHHKLTGAYRVLGGPNYHHFVEQLLSNPELIRPIKIPNYDFCVFVDIERMIEMLQQKAKEGYQVALVAAFTESPGDPNNKTARNPLNLRIGYPLYSGFDHYQGKKLEIYWLMDEKTQYPNFWYKKESNKLTNCASIYGCQGFEADYVGVIWGRDLVWRDGQWELGPNCEDTIGRTHLKKLIEQKDRQKALPLLKNRYRIFLTRGIHGTYVYCEDAETAQLLQKIGKKVRSDK